MLSFSDIGADLIVLGGRLVPGEKSRERLAELEVDGDPQVRESLAAVALHGGVTL